MDGITRFLIDQLTEQFGIPAEETTPGSTFESLGVDSLVLTELSIIIRNRYDVSLDDEDLSEQLTISAMARRVDEQRVAQIQPQDAG